MVTPTLLFEQSFWEKGYKFICGMDEVGRGCFAGSVVVGAVIFPRDFSSIAGIADSKLLKPRQREKMDKTIKKHAISWSIGEVPVSAIDKIGIGKATQMAFRKALKLLPMKADFVLVDAFYVDHLSRKKQEAIRDGDKICVSIAAASIIAKVYRDKLMRKLHKKYPQYGFVKHKGYGTKIHQEAIKKHGLSRIHRRSFNLAKFMM